MELIIFVLLVLAAALGLTIAMRHSLRGYNKNAVDRDGDGVIQEGTKWERGVDEVVPTPDALAELQEYFKVTMVTEKVFDKPKAKKAPVKKAAAKKAPAKKAAPKKK